MPYIDDLIGEMERERFDRLKIVGNKPMIGYKGREHTAGRTIQESVIERAIREIIPNHLASEVKRGGFFRFNYQPPGGSNYLIEGIRGGDVFGFNIKRVSSIEAHSPLTPLVTKKDVVKVSGHQDQELGVGEWVEGILFFAGVVIFVVRPSFTDGIRPYIVPVLIGGAVILFLAQNGLFQGCGFGFGMGLGCLMFVILLLVALGAMGFI